MYICIEIENICITSNSEPMTFDFVRDLLSCKVDNFDGHIRIMGDLNSPLTINCTVRICANINAKLKCYNAEIYHADELNWNLINAPNIYYYMYIEPKIHFNDFIKMLHLRDYIDEKILLHYFPNLIILSIERQFEEIIPAKLLLIYDNNIIVNNSNESANAKLNALFEFSHKTEICLYYKFYNHYSPSDLVGLVC
jgi:hypothetical protein